MEAAGCALLLSEADDAEVITSTVFDYSHNLNGEVDLFDVKDWQRSSSDTYFSRSNGFNLLTVLLANSREQNIPFFINLNIPDSPFAPLSQQDSNFLSGATTRNLQA